MAIILLNIEKRILQNNLGLDIIVYENIISMLSILGELIVLCGIAVLIKNRKIKKINAITLLKET